PPFPQALLLQVAKLADALPGELEQGCQFVVAKGRLFARPLNLDELAAAGHYHVHIDVGGHVLRIIEVQHRFATNDSHADCGDAITEGEAAGIGQVLLYAAERIDQGNERPGDTCSARAAVGLEHVAIDRDRTLAESIEID